MGTWLQQGRDWIYRRLERRIAAYSAVSYTHLDVYKRQPLGPLYLGAGLADDSNASLYLLLGRLF